jgi:hypothetical protein
LSDCRPQKHRNVFPQPIPVSFSREGTEGMKERRIRTDIN